MAADRDDILSKTCTVGELLRRRVAASGSQMAFMVPDRKPTGPNTWREVTWNEFDADVHKVAAGLLALGLQSEQRVAIASSTRYEWVLADLGVACAGGALTTVYPNTTAPDVCYILEDSDSRFVVAENQAQVAKLRDFDELYQGLQHIIIIDDDRAPADREDKRVITWGELLATGERHLAEDAGCVERAVDSGDPDALATLIYTSGATGRPKGVEITHRSWTYLGIALDTRELIHDHGLQYLWLPLSHVFGKALVTAQVAIGFASAVDGRVDRIVEGLGEVHPTFMCGAPRIFEKVRAAVMTANPQGGVKGQIARWAFAVGRESRRYRLEGRPMPAHLRLAYSVADRLVFSQLKARMGGRIEFFISGSAKLSPQVQEWFYSAGITLLEGYGSTETCAVAFVDETSSPRFGTVGLPLPGLEAKIADDGELLLRGPSVTRGYHNLPEVNAESFTDGWFHTGDIGEIDADGRLRITDRKSEMLKTSGGKYVAPQKVESAIAANIPYVAQSVVVGDGRKYVSALLVLDKDSLLKWGHNHGHESMGYAELSQLPEVRASIEKRMQAANAKLERWETVKKFTILDHEFSVSKGEVTPNMKVRRKNVAKIYADQIDAMYDKEPGDE